MNKGYWDYRSKIKKKLFRKQYPNIKIIYINQKEYNVITKQFSKVIPNWEK